MKRVFLAIFGLLLGVSLIRASSGADYLSLREFLYMLSTFDIGFNEVQNAFDSIATLAHTATSANDVLELIGRVITVPFAVVVDVASLVYNFGRFILIDVLCLF